MKKFSFRLQKVLEYREMATEWAKEAFMSARVARLQGERRHAEWGEKRKALLATESETLQARRALEACLEEVDAQEKLQARVVEDLMSDEGAALKDWLQKRQELEALQKLRNREFEVWRRESERFEQKEIDEWSNRKRAA